MKKSQLDPTYIEGFFFFKKIRANVFLCIYDLKIWIVTHVIMPKKLLVTIDFVKRHAKIILVCLFILRTQA